MKILLANRGKGKTTELIKLSNKEWKYIICSTKNRADNIIKMANKMNLDIPYPITFRELPIRSPYIKEVLVDDFEDLLIYLVGKPISIATTSCEIIDINKCR